jgi:hypothetical protein
MSLDFAPARRDFDSDGRADLFVYARKDEPMSNATVDTFVAYSSGIVDERTTSDLAAGVGGRLWFVGADQLQPLGSDADGDGEPDYVLASAEGHTPARVVTRMSGDPPYSVEDAIGWEIDCPDEYASVRTTRVGDVNGDGNVDVAVLCELSSLGTNDMITFVVFAGPAGTDVDLATLGERGLTIVDGDPYAGGYVAAGAGDVDGDGLGDLVVGYEGRMSIVLGRATGETISLAPGSSWGGCSVWCDAQDSGCGAPSIAALGDLDGDAADEVAIAVGSDIYILFESVCDAGHTGLDERVDAGTAAVIRIPTAVAGVAGREVATNGLVVSMLPLSLDPDEADDSGVYTVPLPTAGTAQDFAMLVEAGAASRLDGPYRPDLVGARVGLAGEYFGIGSAAVAWSAPDADDLAMNAGRVTIERVAP